MQQAHNLSGQQSPQNSQQFLINPFEHKYKSKGGDQSPGTFINHWVESIFYRNKKVDLQAKIDIYWTAIEERTFDDTSSSEIYSAIRESIENMAWKLRKLIDQSFNLLKNNSKHFCKMSQTSSSWQINWLHFRHPDDHSGHKHIYPPISNLYLTFYKYLCQSAKQVHVLWKTIYDHFSVKDLSLEYFQQHLQQLLLEVLTRPSAVFQPAHMLPVMSLANKCKFVSADKEGTLIRMELTKFKEDQLALNLASATAKKHKEKEFNPEEPRHFNRETLLKKQSSFKLREKDCRFPAKPKVDVDLIEQIRSQYLNSYTFNEQMREKIIRFRQFFDQYKIDQSIKKDDTIFTPSPYETSDHSSQDDDLSDLYGDEKDELIQESQQVEVEMADQKYQESLVSAKLSASTGNEDNSDQYDTIIKSQDLENPPEFMLQEDVNSTDFFPEEVDDRNQSQSINRDKLFFTLEDIKALKRVSALKLPQHQSSHQIKNVEKTRKKITKVHQKRQHSKCCLEEEKQKLQKYRKQLEKQKEDLLREVERFMKQKDKDNTYYHRFTCNHFNKGCKKHNQKNCFRYTQEIKTIDFSKGKTTINHLHEETDQMKMEKEYIQNNMFKSQCQERDLEDDESSAQTTEISHENWLEEFKDEHKKMSKRQKKLRKKIERQMDQFMTKEKKIGQNNKQSISQQEQQMTHFLETLNISKDNRAICHIQESRLDKWKGKVFTVHKQPIKPIAQPESQPKSSNKKKKKKIRQNS